jgi:hypothetical protein
MLSLLHGDRRNAWAPFIAGSINSKVNDDSKFFPLLCLQLDNVAVARSFFSSHPDFVVKSCIRQLPLKSACHYALLGLDIVDNHLSREKQ